MPGKEFVRKIKSPENLETSWKDVLFLPLNPIYKVPIKDHPMKGIFKIISYFHLVAIILCERDSFAFSLRRVVASNRPLGACIKLFKSLLKPKKNHTIGVVLFWRSERDLNPRALFRRLLP